MAIRDGDWNLFDWDAVTGRTVWRRDLPDGGDEFRVDYPVTDVVEANKTMRNMAKKDWTGDYHLVASIPAPLIYGSSLGQAASEGDSAYLKRWLNDPDNVAFRTKEGRL